MLECYKFVDKEVKCKVSDGEEPYQERKKWKLLLVQSSVSLHVVGIYKLEQELFEASTEN